MVKVALYHYRADSPTYRVLNEILMSENIPVQFIFPQEFFMAQKMLEVGSLW
jgi:dTDP-4-dehydrorhamnose 3,5-epimerase